MWAVKHFNAVWYLQLCCVLVDVCIGSKHVVYIYPPTHQSLSSQENNPQSESQNTPNQTRKAEPHTANLYRGFLGNMTFKQGLLNLGPQGILSMGPQG